MRNIILKQKIGIMVVEVLQVNLIRSLSDPLVFWPGSIDTYSA